MRKYTFTNSGGVTRSTVGGGATDPRFEVTNDALHWIWSWRLQVQRHAGSTAQDGDGSTHLERRQAFSRTSYDEHMIAVVDAHLVTALKRAEAQFGERFFDDEAGAALTLLRNLYEHWDEQRPSFTDPAAVKVKSGKTFTALFPEGKPWSVTYAGNDYILCGVVPIHALTSELDAVEARILALEDRFRAERAMTSDGEGAA